MKGWETRQLGEVCEMINRGIAPRYIDKDGICVINQKCIRNHTINFELARRHDISTKSVNPERYIQVGDVLVNSTGTGTLGRVAQVRKKLNEITTVDTHVTIVRPHPGRFFNDFFGYMLVRIEDEISSSGEGASGQTELARSTIAERFKVSFPKSIPEQKRIVAIVDQAFEAIDGAIDNTKQNLTNTHELFDSYLNAIFTQKGDGWEEKKLGALINVLTDYHANGSYKKLKQNVTLLDEDSYAYMVRSTDFENNFTNSLKYIDQHAYEFLSKSKVFADDIIISKIGNAGKVYLMPKIDRPCSLAMNLFLLRINEKQIRSGYLYFFLESQFGKVQIAERLNGTATKTIRKDAVRSINIFVAPITEQKYIVEKLDLIIFETQRLKAIYQQKLAALTELKQSILQKAFTGELTADSAKAR